MFEVPSFLAPSQNIVTNLRDGCSHSGNLSFEISFPEIFYNAFDESVEEKVYQRHVSRFRVEFEARQGFWCEIEIPIIAGRSDTKSESKRTFILKDEKGEMKNLAYSMSPSLLYYYFISKTIAHNSWRN
jgi:hypothetical protein